MKLSAARKKQSLQTVFAPNRSLNHFTYPLQTTQKMESKIAQKNKDFPIRNGGINTSTPLSAFVPVARLTPSMLNHDAENDENSIHHCMQPAQPSLHIDDHHDFAIIGHSSV